MHAASSAPLCLLSFCYDNIIKPVALSHLQTLEGASSDALGAGSMLQRETQNNRYEKSWGDVDISEEPGSFSRHDK